MSLFNVVYVDLDITKVFYFCEIRFTNLSLYRFFCILHRPAFLIQRLQIYSSVFPQMLQSLFFKNLDLYLKYVCVKPTYSLVSKWRGSR